MPHALEPYRDDLDALIGPLEQVEHDFSEVRLAVQGLSIEEYIGDRRYAYKADSRLWGVLGGLEQAMDDLRTLVAEIDQYEEPEPEPEEVEDEDEPEDEAEDEDDDQ